jgi:hypothetical protein
MTIRKATKNPVAGVRTFFVQSESNPKTEYTVVEVKRDGTVYYCSCNDFFFRKLPFIHTNLFSNCKHGNAVKEAIENV